MRIIRLNIDKFKCLENFEIKFDGDEGGSCSILIGQNGTGKSTMMEALLQILMSFDSDAIEKRIDYNYKLDYFFGGETISIHKNAKIYDFWVDSLLYCHGEMSDIKQSCSKFFPERINYFYSGFNSKPLPQFNLLNTLYVKKCRAVLRDYWKMVAGTSDEFSNHFPKRKYNYCKDDNTALYLLSILGGYSTYEKEYMAKECHITAISQIKITLNIQQMRSILKETRDNNDWVYQIIEFIDERFVDMMRKEVKYEDDKQIFISLSDFSEQNIDPISVYEFFEKLATLFDAKYQLLVRVGRNTVDCDDLSEGQRQLIKILGILGICKNEDTLVLMDEPDAHMNPTWKYSLNDTIQSCLRDAINTQAIIATHDPLIINGVPKELIRIFTHDTDKQNARGVYISKAVIPTENTIGMGIDGLLQSEYYNLETVLDKATQKLMDEKRKLLVKRKENGLTEEEQKRFLSLRDQINNSAFTRYLPIDNYYDDFIVALKKLESDSPVSNSEEAIEARTERLKEILQGVVLI